MQMRAALALVLALAGCAQSESPTAQVLAFTCDATDRYTDASVTIRNTSAAPLTHLKVHIRFGDAVEDRYLRPLELPPQAMGTAKIGRRGRHACQLMGIQDERGRQVALQQ